MQAFKANDEIRLFSNELLHIDLIGVAEIHFSLRVVRRVQRGRAAIGHEISARGVHDIEKRRGEQHNFFRLLHEDDFLSRRVMKRVKRRRRGRRGFLAAARRKEAKSCQKADQKWFHFFALLEFVLPADGPEAAVQVAVLIFLIKDVLYAAIDAGVFIHLASQ